MTAAEMLDSLNAVYTQIRADQKKEEYDDILCGGGISVFPP